MLTNHVPENFIKSENFQFYIYIPSEPKKHFSVLCNILQRNNAKSTYNRKSNFCSSINALSHSITSTNKIHENNLPEKIDNIPPISTNLLLFRFESADILHTERK